MLSPDFPRIIAALQLPPFRSHEPCRSMAWYEDFLLHNARIFVEEGVQAIKIQDETRETDAGAQRTIARVAVLGRMVRNEFPHLRLGIIVQAHDAIAPLAIADAAGAEFVRLKVFVGAATNAEGLRNGLSVQAGDYRQHLNRPDINLFADVHDRTCQPLNGVPNLTAALWAQSMGADSLVITGSDFSDTLDRLREARAGGVHLPLTIGGGVNAGNVHSALATADHVVVSTALMRDGAPMDAFDLWDKHKVRAFMDAAHG
jgi:predicted TIM-barrel enzyme